MISDCGKEFEDEPVLLALKTKMQMFQCQSWEIPCMEGHIRCFNLTDICLYKLSAENHMIPCRNGGHLENCEEFECNMIFKCPNYYCVPWAYVCDGKWDCPFGEDELSNTVCIGQAVCEEMYKCRHQPHRCLSIGNVCDGQMDCLYHDDEKFCELKSLQCPVSCSCLIFAITCVNVSHEKLQFYLNVLYLAVSIFNSNIKSLNIFEYKLENIKFIQLPGNNITSVCPLLSLKNISFIDISNNNIIQIIGKCFSVSKYLNIIYLNDNNIIFLNTYAFHNLYHLKFLNLSNNRFTNLPSKCFSHLLTIKVLYLENIKLKNIYPDTFFSTNVKLISALDYKISCVADNSYCTSYPPWYISCSHILPDESIKVNYIAISVSTICLNSLCMLLQFLNLQKEKKYKAFQITVIGLNFSDILCGIYLASIWVFDLLFSGIYLINEDLWKSHLLCFTSLCIILWFTVSSQLMILYLSGSRLHAVINPIKRLETGWKKIIYHVTTIIFFSFCFSLVVALLFKMTEKHLPTSLCLPFIDPSGSSIITKVTS